ncbi:hypothetical protein JOB18_038813, partial [Solea senegalensis]
MNTEEEEEEEEEEETGLDGPDRSGEARGRGGISRRTWRDRAAAAAAAPAAALT